MWCPSSQFCETLSTSMGGRKKSDINFLLNTPPSSPPQNPSSGRSSTNPPPIDISRIGTPGAGSSRGGSSRSDAEKPYKCPKCGTGFRERGNLNKHILSVHEGQKHHECSYCKKKFAFRDGLLRHISQVHNNERRHVCQLCGQRFKQRTHLAKHRRSVHKINDS